MTMKAHLATFLTLSPTAATNSSQNDREWPVVQAFILYDRVD